MVGDRRLNLYYFKSPIAPYGAIDGERVKVCNCTQELKKKKIIMYALWDYYQCLTVR